MVSMTTRPESQETRFQNTLGAARNGDADAIEALFRTYYPHVNRLVHEGLAHDLRTNRPWLTSRFSTGDVVQEVFRSLLKDLSGFRGKTEDAFRGYVAMVVRNRLLDAIRFHQSAQRDGRRTRAVPEDLDRPSSAPDPAAAALEEEQANDLHEVLQTFPERERLLLRARLEEEATFQELTEQLGYSSQAATRRAFFSAQAQLVIRLGQRRSQ